MAKTGITPKDIDILVGEGVGVGVGLVDDWPPQMSAACLLR